MSVSVDAIGVPEGEAMEGEQTTDSSHGVCMAEKNELWGVERDGSGREERGRWVERGRLKDEDECWMGFVDGHGASVCRMIHENEATISEPTIERFGDIRLSSCDLVHTGLACYRISPTPWPSSSPPRATDTHWDHQMSWIETLKSRQCSWTYAQSGLSVASSTEIGDIQ